MPTPNVPQGRVRRTVNDLVMAEMFLLQATIESATVIGDGFSELGKQVTGREAADREPLASVLQRIADDAVEPYTTRFRYFRDMLNADD
ncbi:MAG: hypothetical protein R3E50_11465 [Halioglobus sp.]